MKLPQLGVAHARGRYIAVDGPEGAGKTTAVLTVVAALQDEGHAVMYVKEPGDLSAFGGIIRQVLLGKGYEHRLSATTEFLLVAASRTEQMENRIIPFMEEGGVVVSDRCYLSSYAYQGGGNPRLVAVMHEVHRLILPYAPNLTVMLDVDDQLSLTRQLERGALDRMEEKGRLYHAEVNRAFRQMAQDNDLVVVDGSRDRGEVVEEMLEFIRPVLA